MNPVHVRRDDKPSEHSVYRLRNAHIAVVKHGGGIEHDLKDQNRDWGGAHQYGCRRLDEHGQHHFYRMKTYARGDIVIRIGMVDHVESPQAWHSMEKDVLQVDRQIEYSKREQPFHPERPPDGVQEPPSLVGRHHGQAHCS